MAKSAVLLVGHGTRDERGRAEFFATADLVSQCLSDEIVQPCFLELAEPTITAGLERLARSGASRVVVVPLLLFSAGHAKRDIPEAVRRAAGRSGFERIEQAAELGCHPRLLSLSRERFHCAAQKLPAVGADRRALLMVARGSSDRSATAKMHEYAARCGEAIPCRAVRTAFLDRARPSLQEGLDQVRRLPVDNVIVLPHLLFQGQLLQSLKYQVSKLQHERTGKNWAVAGHFGPSGAVAGAICDRFLQAHTPQEVKSA